MSETFAQSARQLAGLASRALGWRPADFWETTPAEITAIFANEESAAGQALSRTEFETLMELHGDG